MWEDPIVAEVHRAREKMMAEYNFDLKAMFADIRKRQASLGERLVRLNQQREPEAHGYQAGASESAPTGG